MHTFHNGTKANDFFGTTTIKEGGEIVFINGTLTTAMKDGYIFIADEMNGFSYSNYEIISTCIRICLWRMYLYSWSRTKYLY